MAALKLLVCVCFAAVLAAIFVSPATADLYDKKTVFTFSAPVEIPGNPPRVLPAGTYTFKLLDSMSDRNIVQIFDKDNRLLATVLTVPDYRPQPSDKTIIKFSETANGAPRAIKEWFYPGDLYGQEFVYPQKRAVELAKASNQPVPSMSNESASNISKPANSTSDASVTAMKNTPLQAEQPSGKQVEVAEVFMVAQPPASDTSFHPSKHNVNSDLASTHEMPKTASPLPLFALLGLMLLAAGMFLGGLCYRRTT